MENLTENSWSIPQRQSPAAIFILFLQTIVEWAKGLLPIIIVSLFRDKRNKPGEDDGIPAFAVIAIIVGVVLLFILFSLLKYWFYTFHISQGKLIINSGWLKKKTLTIPLQNIHEVHIEQSLWQRALQVAKISVDSSGSENIEAKIEALSMKNAEELKAILLSQQQTSPHEQVAENAPGNIQTTLSHADLFKLSLTANHLEAFFILIGLGINLLDNLKDAFKLDSWQFLKSYALEIAAQTTVFVTMLVVAVAIISIVVSIIRTLIKYYNFKIEEVKQGWKISYGLINHQQRIIPANKIQILSWNANWLRRKIDFWILNVQSVGHREEKHKQHLKLPVTSLGGVLSLVPMYQTSSVFNVHDGLKIAPEYWKRRTLITAVPITLLLGTIFYLWLGIASMFVVLLLVYLTWYFNTWYKVFRWQINDEGLQLYSGVWGRRFTLLTWKKVQQVQLTQSTYQRQHHLASLLFKTAGGSVKLPFIQFDVATRLANLSLYYVESREDNWM